VVVVLEVADVQFVEGCEQLGEGHREGAGGAGVGQF
jgi:hypothetical protein